MPNRKTHQENIASTCSLEVLPDHLQQFAWCLQRFDQVREACSSMLQESMKISPDYEMKIAAFKESYLDLGIPVTPKVHAVFEHVLQFCQKHAKGLVFFSLSRPVNQPTATFLNTG